MLTELTKQHPTQIWEHVSKHLEARGNFLSMFAIEKWMREADLSATEKEKGALTLISTRKKYGNGLMMTWKIARHILPIVFFLKDT